MIYPWQQTQWQHIHTLIKTARLPHALLLTGEKGLGKQAFAQQLAARLLCDAATETACGKCQACHWISQGAHPDMQQIVSEDGTIKVDMIRELMPFLQRYSHAGGKKVILIHPIEQMNQAAANALLKALEEPTDNTHFILSSDNVSLVLATVKSRCQIIAFAAARNQVSTWLQSQGYAPAAIDSVLDFFAGQPLVAQQWLSQPEQLTQLKTLMADIAQLTGQAQYLPEISTRWQRMESLELLEIILQIISAQALSMITQQNLPSWLNLYQSLLEIRRSLIQGYNLSKALIVEQVIALLVRLAN